MTSNFKPSKSRTDSAPRLSTEEWVAKKQAEKEAVYAMIDETATEVVSDPAKFQSFLDTQSRMDRYSAANALLVYKQRPDATQLKSFGDWGEENIKVNKGEKSFSILEPVEYTKKDGSPGIAYNVKRSLMWRRPTASASLRPASIVIPDSSWQLCWTRLPWPSKAWMSCRTPTWGLSTTTISRRSM